MYGVGKTVEQDGINANMESDLNFPLSDSGLFIVEVLIMHSVSIRSCLKALDSTK